MSIALPGVSITPSASRRRTHSASDGMSAAYRSRAVVPERGLT